MSKDANSVDARSPIIEIKNLDTCLGGTYVHKGLNLTVEKGEVLGIVGGSGSGKTTLLQVMLALLKPTAGSVYLFGEDLLNASPKTLLKIQRRWGVLFQQNALFSALTIAENVAFPIQEHISHLDAEMIQQLALLKMLMAGLSADSAYKFPAEVSGGMQKRAGIARAIALDPELIFLDEPTAGLDPNKSEELDDLILQLQSTMGLTVVMITHDLESLWKVTNRVAFLGEGVVLDINPMAKLVNNPHPLIQAFFNGPRGRDARIANEGDNH